MRNINIKGTLTDSDKIFHLHMSLSIRSNGENVDIRNNFNYIEAPVNTNTTRTWGKERYKSFSLWKFKELLIQRITSITFPLLNETLFTFDSTSPTSDMTTHAKGAMLISKLIFTSPLSLFDRLQTAFFIDL